MLLLKPAKCTIISLNFKFCVLFWILVCFFRNGWEIIFNLNNFIFDLLDINKNLWPDIVAYIVKLCLTVKLSRILSDFCMKNVFTRTTCLSLCVPSFLVLKTEGLLGQCMVSFRLKPAWVLDLSLKFNLSVNSVNELWHLRCKRHFFLFYCFIC